MIYESVFLSIHYLITLAALNLYLISKYEEGSSNIKIFLLEIAVIMMANLYNSPPDNYSFPTILSFK